MAARIAAPVAFLLAITVAALLVRDGLRDDEPASSGQPVPVAVATSNAGVHVIESGDTLAGIAGRYGTTVDRLVVLNPGVDAVALEVGTRLRVR